MGNVLDVSLADFKSGVDRFDEHMQADFHLPAAETDPLDADSHALLADEPDAKRTEQIVTHLQMLGYLSATAKLSRDEIDAQLDRWDVDFQDARARGVFEIALEGENLERIPWAEARVRYL